jgi:tryptophan-rich hypothetical protein
MSDSHASQRPYPVHPTHLLHSKWSTAEGYDELEFCHWEVITFLKRKGEVELRATLDEDARVRLPWRELRDRARWVPGWS